MKTSLPKILNEPIMPDNLEGKAKWLAGEGAGSWFVISESEKVNCWDISRYSPEGNLECKGTFSSKHTFYINEEYVVTYPSHCAKVTVKQNNKTIQLITTLS